MSEEILIRLCSPTLAGLKTGSLFSCPFDSKEEILCEIRVLNHELVPKGLYILPLHYADARVLIYLFRPSQLKQDLSDSAAARLLTEAGYQSTESGQCILELMHRLSESKEFPHEIGLFLSYPPEDVRGFIENHAGNFKCVGSWKVYGDEDKAKLRFAQYRKCTSIYYRQWACGKTVAQLAVPVQ